MNIKLMALRISTVVAEKEDKRILNLRTAVSDMRPWATDP